MAIVDLPVHYIDMLRSGYVYREDNTLGSPLLEIYYTFRRW